MTEGEGGLVVPRVQAVDTGLDAEKGSGSGSGSSRVHLANEHGEGDGEGRAMSVPIPVAGRSTDEAGRSTYFTPTSSSRAGEGSTMDTPKARVKVPSASAEEDPDRTLNAVKVVDPQPLSQSRMSSTSQRSTASQSRSQRKRNSQSNRLGFAATKPASQDAPVEVDVKLINPSEGVLDGPLKRKAYAWNNARAVAAKRRRLSDEKQVETRRSQAEGERSTNVVSENVSSNPIRTEERPPRPTWTTKSPSVSDTEEEDEEDEVPMSMAAIKRGKQTQKSGPRLLEEAFRRTKTAVVDMEIEVDEVSPGSVVGGSPQQKADEESQLASSLNLPPPPFKNQLAPVQEEIDEVSFGSSSNRRFTEATLTKRGHR